MRRIVGAVFQSLDGVIQAPGGPSEDPTGGFAHGGWQMAYDDEVAGGAVATFLAPPHALLLGRRTYDIFASYWPYVGGDAAAMAAMFTAAGKRLFGDGTPATAVRLVEHQVGPSDVVIATYEPAGDVSVDTAPVTPPNPREDERQRRMRDGSW